MRDQLHRWTAIRLRDALAARDLSAVEVLDAHLAQIEAVNPQVNAIVTLAGERALETARALDRRHEPAGPLHGIPVAVKDLLDTAGMRTTYGSQVFAEHVPTSDALLVQRLRAAGAVIVGKTNVPEYGAGSHTFNEVFGPTHNPWSLGRSAGGSSGGAAAALAAGLVPLADGSDLGGSLRNPAAFCGVVGVRPSPGRVPSIGDGDPWDPHPVLGPMARNVADAGLLLSAIAGADPRDPLSIAESPAGFAQLAEVDLRGVRICWSRTVDGLPIDPSITTALETARETLIELGAIVEDREPDLSGADEVFETFRSLSMGAALGAIGADQIELIKPELHDELRWARALSLEHVERARTARAELWHRLCTLAESYDLLALPATQVTPFDVSLRWPQSVEGVEMERYYTWMRACSRITATTLPAISIPAGFTDEALPVGLQLVGRPRGELRLLSQAAALEAALGVPTLSPLA